MIVPMLKLSLLVFHEDYQQFLEKLRDMGVVHINANVERSATDELLQEKLRLAKRIDELIRAIDAYPVKNENVEPAQVSLGGEELMNQVEANFKSLELSDGERQSIQKDLSLYAPWGEIPVERIAKLKDSGWDMQFYSIPERMFNEEWVEQYNAVKVSTDRGNLYFVTIQPVGSNPTPGIEQYLFPEKSEAELKAELKAIDKVCNDVDLYFAAGKASIKAGLKEYQQQIYGVTDMCKVQDATEAILDGKVKYVVGWIPEEKRESISAELDKSSVSYEFAQPTPDDDVPVQLRNNKFARLFEPITEMFALPKYDEIDSTPLFAPFFMLFFGLCLGDGGYGLIICLLGAIFMKKVPEKMRGMVKLIMLLGASTVVVGILTGAFFGMALDSVTWPWLKGVKEYFITANNYKDDLGGYDPMMVFAVIIGLIQIFFGMFVSAAKAIKQFGIKYAWSTLGWAIGLMTGAAIGVLSALNVEIPALQYTLYSILGVCVFAIMFLNSPGKNIFVNVGSSLWSAYNMATGLLGDTLSYIRLFALGLTGSILGSVFNSLALDLTADMTWAVRWLPMLLILLFGHTINFGINMIGAFVHPLRLTFVEFYKNSNFEGGGKAYAPLKNRTK
ncbi:MAG: hypothetical protein J6K74_04585 [Marinifilaceae bacterium]|nr:hypothetical protein [Marinifilaceae bacterium]